MKRKDRRRRAMPCRTTIEAVRTHLTHAPTRLLTGLASPLSGQKPAEPPLHEKEGPPQARDALPCNYWSGSLASYMPQRVYQWGSRRPLSGQKPAEPPLHEKEGPPQARDALPCNYWSGSHSPHTCPNASTTGCLAACLAGRIAANNESRIRQKTSTTRAWGASATVRGTGLDEPGGI